MKFRDLNVNEYIEQLNYFANYYGNNFRFGQGTENLLDCINKYSKDGTLIDFGSGSNIYFWLLAFNTINKVTCVDISRESFYVNEQIRNKVLYPKSVEYPEKKYKKNLNQILDTSVEYIIKDIFKDSLDNIVKYNNVSQFGLLGLSKNVDNYIKNFAKLFNFLEEKGVFLGANWVFSKTYANKKGFSNIYLTPELIENIAKQYNCKILMCNLVHIKNDDNYDSVLIYALEKNNNAD